MGLRSQGIELREKCQQFSAKGLGFRIRGSEFRGKDLRFRDTDFGLRI